MKLKCQSILQSHGTPCEVWCWGRIAIESTSVYCNSISAERTHQQCYQCGYVKPSNDLWHHNIFFSKCNNPITKCMWHCQYSLCVHYMKVWDPKHWGQMKFKEKYNQTKLCSFNAHFLLFPESLTGFFPFFFSKCFLSCSALFKYVWHFWRILSLDFSPWASSVGQI